jgi:hypothetical protein
VVQNTGQNLMAAYLLESIREEQRPEDTTFIGGVPRLPAEVTLPHCAFCGALQSFIFQVAFPADHVWVGYTLAFFYCTACEYPDDEIIIPMFFKREGETLDIPADFLEEYQMNFRVLVFPTEQGQLRQDYEPRVRFSRWDMLPVADASPEPEKPHPPFLAKVGGQPFWYRSDNAPTTFAGAVPMHFLMQVELRSVNIVPDAPPQMYTNMYREWVQYEGKYSLFLGSGIYFFGTPEPDQRLVYIAIQK